MVALLETDATLAADNAALIDQANVVNQQLEDTRSSLTAVFDELNCAANEHDIISGRGFSKVQELLLEADDILEAGYAATTQAGLVDAVDFPPKGSWLQTWWDFSSP